jgi:hypothetical protein
MSELKNVSVNLETLRGLVESAYSDETLKKLGNKKSIAKNLEQVRSEVRTIVNLIHEHKFSSVEDFVKRNYEPAEQEALISFRNEIQQILVANPIVTKIEPKQDKKQGNDTKKKLKRDTSKQGRAKQTASATATNAVAKALEKASKVEIKADYSKQSCLEKLINAKKEISAVCEVITKNEKFLVYDKTVTEKFKGDLQETFVLCRFYDRKNYQYSQAFDLVPVSELSHLDKHVIISNGAYIPILAIRPISKELIY